MEDENGPSAAEEQGYVKSQLYTRTTPTPERGHDVRARRDSQEANSSRYTTGSSTTISKAEAHYPKAALHGRFSPHKVKPQRRVSDSPSGVEERAEIHKRGARTPLL